MKISQDIRRKHGGGLGEADAAAAEAGMAEKSREFAASGNRVYLPIAD
ncbi:thiamine biosynthesis protein ThiC [Streptomyces sp. NPDC006283]